MSPFFYASSANFACSFIQCLLSLLRLLFTLLLISEYCVCVLSFCCLVLILFTFSFANFLLSVSFHVSSEIHSFCWFSLKPSIFSLSLYIYIYLYISFLLLPSSFLQSLLLHSGWEDWESIFQFQFKFFPYLWHLKFLYIIFLSSCFNLSCS